MSETTNYKLHLTDDNSERFLDWRKAMNGTDNSNMVKIDVALANKADHSDFVFDVLKSAAWDGSSPPFTQTIQIEGLTAEQNGIIDVAQNITDEQFQVACDAKMRISKQTDGNLTVRADGDKPSCDIPVALMIFW